MILDQVRDRTVKGDVKSKVQMQDYSKKLRRKMVQGSAKEESEPKPEWSNRKNACEFQKYYPPYWFQKLTILLLTPNTHHRMRVSPSSTSNSTERMRAPAFPTEEIYVPELYFSILLLNYNTRGYDFCFYLNLLLKSFLKHPPPPPKDNINAKNNPKTPQYSCKTLCILVKDSSKPGFLCNHDSAFWYSVNIQTGYLYATFTPDIFLIW